LNNRTLINFGIGVTEHKYPAIANTERYMPFYFSVSSFKAAVGQNS